MLMFLACSGATTTFLHESCHQCLLSDLHNYDLSAELEIASVPLAAYSDVELSWDQLSVDIQGHSVESPEWVEKLTLVVFPNLQPAEVAHGMATDSLLQSDIAVFVLCTPTSQRCQLSDFRILNADPQLPSVFEPGQGSWLVALQSPYIRGAHSFVFLEPSASAEQSQVHVDNSTARLNVDVHFDNLTPVVVAAEEPEITINWQQLTRDGYGNELLVTQLDRAFVGHYRQRPQELSERFFQLDRQYESYWTMPLGPAGNASLDELSGTDPFLGITNEGTWLLGLECSTCTNPAPKFITQLIAE